jgi:site-specific DNA recombinase
MDRHKTKKTHRAPTTPMSAVLYARVSSKDQEREGFSIPAQQKLLQEYGAGQNLTIVRKFIDVRDPARFGVSGGC